MSTNVLSLNDASVMIFFSLAAKYEHHVWLGSVNMSKHVEKLSK